MAQEGTFAADTFQKVRRQAMNQGKGPFNCPVEATLALIGGKYKPLIL